MKVYAVYRNADMTEGRGPMILDRVYLHKEKAEAYVDEQPGVMGYRTRWSQQKYGDWQVQELKVIE